MGDTIKFSPKSGVNPTFAGGGSKLEHPDVLPIFLGSGWQGNAMRGKIMAALRKLAQGPYFDGLKQYGYVGPVQIRDEQVDTSPYTIALPPLTPGMDQANNVSSAVSGYISNLIDNDGIANVDDNHDLFVVVFLDASNPRASKMDAAGNVKLSATGANGPWYGGYELLDDETRFQMAWINTASGSLDAVTQTASHELVEGISDPFNSGWEETDPGAVANQGQLSDVCNQAAIVDGVSVTAYWSNADAACIVPTPGTRLVLLSQAVTKREQHDGPHRTGYVNLGLLCAAGFFGYFERTWLTDLTITATLHGYESPIVDWRINGTSVPFLNGTVDVPVEWEPEPRTSPLQPRSPKPHVAHVKTWKPSISATELKIEIGPGDGNCYLTIEAYVRESFDDSELGGLGLTAHHAILELDMKNEEVIWDSNYTDAKKQCDRIHHLAAGPAGVIGPPKPGDPPDLANIIERAIHDHSSHRNQLLKKAADLVRATRPELAADLLSLVRTSNSVEQHVAHTQQHG